MSRDCCARQCAHCAASCDLFLHKIAPPALLNKRDAPVVRLSCLKSARNKMPPKFFIQNSRNTNAGPVLCRKRLILAKNGVSRPIERAIYPSNTLILTKKHEKKDAVKIFDLQCPEHDCRAHFRAPIRETLTGHNSVQKAIRPKFDTNQLHSIRSFQ